MITNIINDMKIDSFKYDQSLNSFVVTCILPGTKHVGVYTLNKKFFPNHTPVQFLDEKVQVGDVVYVWLKEKELLKKEGWKETTKHTMSKEGSPFRIGKSKQAYLGGAHKGTVALNKDFSPIIMLGEYRFSSSEIKCILKDDATLFSFKKGVDASFSDSYGNWQFRDQDQTAYTPFGNFNPTMLQSFVTFLKKAKFV